MLIGQSMGFMPSLPAFLRRRSMVVAERRPALIVASLIATSRLAAGAMIARGGALAGRTRSHEAVTPIAGGEIQPRLPVVVVPMAG